MIGQQVGNYVVEAVLGVGGMGSVYLARHTMLGRAAAVKVLLPEFSATPDIVTRFLNEAKAAALIHHPGIVEIYDYGVFGHGTAYIAMELLRGESLGARSRSRRLEPRESLVIVRQICGALHAAHALGIIHRDLKPDNVFIVADPDVVGGERIKLLDFGIAKVSKDVSSTSQQTRTGSIMGTPAYMAPEQCRGVKIDHRADLYSVGCILYELLTRRPPFRGEGAGDVLAAHIYETAPAVDTLAPGVASEIAALVADLLNKAPANRPQTAQELGARVESLLANERVGVISSPAVAARASTPGALAVSTTLSGSVSVAELAPPRPRRRTLAFVAAGGVVAAIAAIAIASSGDGAPDTTGQAAAPPEVAQMPAPPPPVTSPDAAVPTAAPGDAAAAIVDAVSPTIEVTIDDTVPHASQVVLDGRVLGTTPYKGSFPRGRGDQSLRFVLRHAGFADVEIVTPASRELHAPTRTLAALPAPRWSGNGRAATVHGAGTGSAAAGSVAPHQFGDDDTVNPLRQAHPP